LGLVTVDQMAKTQRPMWVGWPGDHATTGKTMRDFGSKLRSKKKNTHFPQLITWHLTTYQNVFYFLLTSLFHVALPWTSILCFLPSYELKIENEICDIHMYPHAHVLSLKTSTWVLFIYVSTLHIYMFTFVFICSRI